jgi:hypothetical protein
MIRCAPGGTGVGCDLAARMLLVVCAISIDQAIVTTERPAT